MIIQDSTYSEDSLGIQHLVELLHIQEATELRIFSGDS